MNCHLYEQELGDYVEGTLPAQRVAAIEAHVVACARCRATVADFTVIRDAARTLEAQLPAAHVWARVAAAIEQERRDGLAATDPSAAEPWWRLATGAWAWRSLAAAAAMVVLLTGGTWLAWRDAAFTATTVAPVVVVDPEVQLAEEHYSAAIGDLEKVTATESGSLDPDTVRVVRANLDVIDQAIGQSRAALKSEPANSVAQESLFDALRSKVQLLQDTVALINEMRKGNQEGAARIMSGMNP